MVFQFIELTWHRTFPPEMSVPFNICVFEFVNHWQWTLSAGAGPVSSFVSSVHVGPRVVGGGDADGGEWPPLHLLCAPVETPLSVSIWGLLNKTKNTDQNVCGFSQEKLMQCWKIWKGRVWGVLCSPRQPQAPGGQSAEEGLTPLGLFPPHWEVRRTPHLED